METLKNQLKKTEKIKNNKKNKIPLIKNKVKKAQKMNKMTNNCKKMFIKVEKIV